MRTPRQWRLDSLAESWAGKILVDHFHFCLLPLSGLTSRCNLNQRMAKRHSNGNSRFWMCHPNTVYQFEWFHALWEGLTDDYGNFCLCCSLVFTEFDKPAITPALGSFGLPQDSTARLSEWADDSMQYIAAMLSLRDRFYSVARELCAQQRFKLKLLDFSLKLL